MCVFFSYSKIPCYLQFQSKPFYSPMKPSWKIRLHRMRHYEYWPFWVFYAPLYVYGLWLALRARSFTYFTAANPGMAWGGVIGQSKAALLAQLDAAYLPQTILVLPDSSFSQVLTQLKAQQLWFPLVAKPDAGERGKSVEKINNVQELQSYLYQMHNRAFLLQEFVEAPIEIGVLYYRFPTRTTGHISSVVLREFLKVTGDGQSSLAELARQQPRAAGRLAYLSRKFAKSWGQVLPEGETVLLEPIGNHNRGTAFLSGQHHISPELVAVFDRITSPLQGFHYGRFDLKAKSWEQLLRGEGIKILELNGVASEPAHIYDPSNDLLSAYRDVFRHAKTIWEISKINHTRGVPYAPLTAFLGALRKHLSEGQPAKVLQ